MDAGRNHRLTYVGGSKNIEDIHEKVVGGSEGPKPELIVGLADDPE
jgi:hypothetical protein